LLFRGTDYDYYISYREPVGFDSSLRSAYRNRTSIHTWQGGSNKTYLRATVGDGETFQASSGELVVKQLAHTADSATLELTLNAPLCEPQAASLVLNPYSMEALPGTTAKVSVALTNQDTQPCAASLFTWQSTQPAGWQAAIEPSSLTLAAGATQAATWNLMVPTDAAEGVYPVELAALRNGSSVASSGATVVVLRDHQSPTVTIVQPQEGATVSGRVRIDAQVDDRVNTAVVRFFIDGVLRSEDTRDPYRMVWDTRKATAGTHTIRVEAVDTAGNVGSQQIQVQVAAGAGKRSKSR
jgi:hypothetical protein